MVFKANAIAAHFHMEHKTDIVLPSVKMFMIALPGGAVVRNPPANAGDMGSSPGPGRSHMPQSN